VIHSFLRLPTWARRSVMVMADVVAVLIAVWASFAIRLGEWWPAWLDDVPWLFPLAVATAVPALFGFGLYHSIVRHAGGSLAYVIVKGVSVGTLLMIAVWILAGGPLVPRSSWIIYWMVAVAIIGSSRFVIRDLLRIRFRRQARRERVAIYGAGEAGAQLAKALSHSPELEPVVFLDDDRDLQGSRVAGLRVRRPGSLPRLIERDEITTVLLAMPSVSHRRRREIIDSLAPVPVKVMAMPAMAEIAAGTKRVDDVREVDIEDLLGRDPVRPNQGLLEACIRGKAVMVTGAGGSIGSELCRQIAALGPQRLVLFERSEPALFQIEQEVLKRLSGKGIEVVAILGSVGHRNRVQRTLQAFGVETVYHAAAYKHVPMVEHNPIEGVQNNVVGTLHTAEAALAAGVSTFVLISTDKAVRPTNVMGATKRFAELILQGLAEQRGPTRFCMVRFGNVLDSSGSVVPVFRAQIRHGGPVTVTHPDVTRYFMTIPEAAQLVLQAGAMGQGGDVFVLDMGEPVRILDLARQMVRLSGLQMRDDDNPDGDIAIEFVGLRPGEKLYEELLIGESDQPTEHPRIRRAQEERLSWAEVRAFVERLQAASKGSDCAAIREVLMEAVRGYVPEGGIVDRLWLSRPSTGSVTPPEAGR
jgi:FlaA1/EpsC-like NDP-sugar epimerase